MALVAVAASVVTLLAYRGTARAHCDTLDGPVVRAARLALESGNLNYVLPWVPEVNEPQLRAVFEQARRVRALGPEAQALADVHFFETAVRLHRAGEGEPYAGLKADGEGTSPAVRLADAAFESASADELVTWLTAAVAQGVGERFAEAQAAQGGQVNDVGARRRAVQAYVAFVHYVEGIYQAAAPALPTYGQQAPAHAH